MRPFKYCPQLRDGDGGEGGVLKVAVCFECECAGVVLAVVSREELWRPPTAR